MIFKKTLGVLAGISLVLLTSATVVAQVKDGGYRIFRPDGPGPHPAVVFASGCSGFKPMFAPNAYVHPAEQLRKLGFVVVWADYLGRRNLNNCMSGGITLLEAGRDAVAAASWLRSQPYVDAKRITALGWSYGGGGVLAALGSHSADQLIFTRAIVYYPYCSDVGPWSNRIPVLVLRAGSDNVARHSMCESALGTGSGEANVKIIDYPGAHHAFDWSELPPNLPESGFGTYRYHPQAAAAAWEEVKRFLQSGR
jgi:dienelactone hydrolase